MARTKRSRKKEQRRQKELAREIEKRRASGEPIVLLRGPKTKTRPAGVSLGTPEDEETIHRREKMLAFVRGARQGASDPA